MDVFLLHAGQPGVKRLLDRINVSSGRRLPKGTQEGETIYVIRWLDGVGRNGGSAPQDVPLPPGVRLLQPAAAVRLACDRRAREKVWNRNGVHTVRSRGEATGVQRRLVIPVFQLDSLGIYSFGGPLGPIGRSPANAVLSVWNGERTPRSLAVRRAEREAVKAVYTLGLDYGIVTLVSDGSGMPAVEDVSPYPPHEEELADRFAEAIVRFEEGLQAERSRTAPIMLGMDPEFVLRRRGPNGKIVMASKFLEPKGAVGCDSVRIGDRLLYPLAELRPAPAAEPGELFRNLYAAMKLAAVRIHDASIEWLAGGMPAKGLPLGGHIHMSGVRPHSDLLRAMDNYMALPLVLLEDVTTKHRRPRYGALGDFRRQFHGGFEYRTLPSWILSPELAMGVLSLARVVCDHYRELGQRPLELADMQEAYYRGDKDKVKTVVMDLWRDLEKTKGYSRYSKHLNKVKSKLEKAEAWNEQQDVRISWNLPPYRV